MDILLNWLTQGSIVGIAAAAALHVVAPSRPRARYAIVWTAYLLVLLLPVISPAVARSTPMGVAPDASTVVTMPAAWWTSPALAFALWGIWAAIASIRVALDIGALRRARRGGMACPSRVLARLPYWSTLSATGRPTRVVLSDEVRAAAVLGGGRPVIALAPALASQLAPADLDRVLVHEWAHVQRRDDLAQVLQRAAHLVMGWHPAAWWLERQIDFEREVACDEFAVTVTGSAKGYAACLATLATMPIPRTAPVAALAITPSRLRARVLRILAVSRAAAVQPWRGVSAVAAVCLAVCTVAIGHVRLVGLDVASAVVEAATASVRPSLEMRRPATQVVTASRTAGPREVVPTRIEARRGEVLAPVASARQASPAESHPGAEPVRPEKAADIAAAPSRDAGGVLSSTAVAVVVAPPWIAAAAHEPEPPDPGSPDAGPGAIPAVPQAASDAARAGWLRAAGAGAAIGRASGSAGKATGKFFSRLGGQIAGSF